MKILPWIGGLSLAANLSLALYTFSCLGPADDARPPLASAEPTSPAPPASDGKSAPVASFVRADTPLAKILDGHDLRAMRDALAAAGLTENDAKLLLRERIHASQAAARAAIEQRRRPQLDAWWYQDDEAEKRFDAQQRDDHRALAEDAIQQLAALFGPDPVPPADDLVHSHARFLPEPKRLTASKIIADYETLERELRSGDPGEQRLPSDLEKLRFLREEFHKDLAALLSPDELREFKLRHSPTAQELKWRLSEMKPTRGEYEAIHDAIHDLDTRFDTSLRVDRPQDFWQQRRAAETEAFSRLRQQLGEARFIDYALSNDHDAPPLRLVVERYQLSPELPRLLWKLRQEAGQEGSSLQNDSFLSADEKRARLAEMERGMRSQIDALLPPEAAADLKNNDLVNWLEKLRRSEFSVFHELGNSHSGFSL